MRRVRWVREEGLVRSEERRVSEHISEKNEAGSEEG